METASFWTFQNHASCSKQGNLQLLTSANFAGTHRVANPSPMRRTLHRDASPPRPPPHSFLQRKSVAYIQRKECHRAMNDEWSGILQHRQHKQVRPTLDNRKCPKHVTASLRLRQSVACVPVKNPAVVCALDRSSGTDAPPSSSM